MAKILRIFLFTVLQVFGDGKPLSDFRPYDQVTPYVIHGRNRRDVDAETDSVHLNEFTLGFEAFGKDYVLDLQLNKDLFPDNYFERHSQDGKAVIRKPTTQDLNREHCYYKGKLKNNPNSWAALSTCQGFSGVIFDGKEMHYIEPASRVPSFSSSRNSTHYFYRHSDMQTYHNYTCGYEGTNKSNKKDFPQKRSRRDAIFTSFRGPNNRNGKPRHLELVLVNDNKVFLKMNSDLVAVINRNKEIANILGGLYAPLNIFIVLVGVVVWSEFDEITLSANGDTTLTNFLYYRRERLVLDHPNDNAQLLTGIVFNGGIVGRALKGSICTYEYSGGVNMDYSPLVGLVATLVAHNLGHNFGMEHDDDDDYCSCPEDQCIMAAKYSLVSPTHWSTCSVEYLNRAFDQGMDYCLRNKPTNVIGPICGNLLVEPGEECDCGLQQFCDNPCCNATSCTLFPNATCATGSCCDLQTCQVKPIATLCRETESECDLPEFCDGRGEDCPDDVYKQDVTACKSGEAYCFSGQCRSHADQCKLLWGPTGKMSDSRCFEENTRGTAIGNCGYFRVNQTYKMCSSEDVLCGMLHCMHLNERLEFGMESVAILSRSFIATGDRILSCRSALVDLGLNSIDPGLVPNGAKCGEDKVCFNQQCKSVGSFYVPKCSGNCSGNGICNSKGQCHCNVGFSPPLCESPSPEGNAGSGHKTDPTNRPLLYHLMFVMKSFLSYIFQEN